MAILALFGGALIYVLNPGVFWDDWVWIHQEPAENIRIGKELGIWWAGYLSNAIYRTNDPVLVLRITSLIAWAVAAAAAVYVMRLRGIVDRVEGFLVFALICGTHVAGVRFVNSVAMYNVYIASFWLGCACLVARPDKLWVRIVAAAFFFFSFHLNSMLVIYALVMALLFAEDIKRALAAGPEDPIVAGGLSRPLSYWFKREPYHEFGQSARRIGLPGLVGFIKDNLLFVALPFLFYASIKFVSLAMSTVLASQQRIYSDYNSIGMDRIFKALIETPRSFLSVIKQYILLISAAVPPNLMAAFVVMALVCVMFFVRWGRMPTWSTVRYQLLMGFLLYVAAIYPYLLVAKPPLLFDFYEARNVMPAVPAIVLTLLGLINAGALLVHRYAPALAIPLRNVACATVLGLSVSCQFVLATDLVKDWARQEAIADYIKERKPLLDTYSTIMFDDKSVGFRINNRKIWNYEYTGLLIGVFGKQTKLGIAPDEYNGWPTRVPLLYDPVFRTRYNLKEHDPSLGQVVVEISNSINYPELRDVAVLLYRHWAGKPVGTLARHFLGFSTYEPFSEVQRHSASLQRIIKVLETFKAEMGVYPTTTQIAPDLFQGKAPAMGLRLPGQARVPAYLNELPYLRGYSGMSCVAPLANALTRWNSMQPGEDLCKIKVECHNPGCGYLYMSDGVDYKLVYIEPVDMPFARQAYPDRVDPIRRAYGYWTPGASRW